MRDSMVITRGMLASLRSMRSLKDVQSIVDAIAAAGLDGMEPQVPEHLLSVWSLIEPTVKANRARYERTCEERRKAGLASSQARKQMLTNAGKCQQMLTNVNDNDNDTLLNESIKKEDTLSSIQEKPKKPTFKKPTLDEVKSYAAEKSLPLDAEAFFDHFEANGWKAGSVPMKDWHAAVRNWARNEKNFNRGPQPQVGYNRPGTEGSYGRYVGKH